MYDGSPSVCWHSVGHQLQVWLAGSQAAPSQTGHQADTAGPQRAPSGKERKGGRRGGERAEEGREGGLEMDTLPSQCSSMEITVEPGPAWEGEGEEREGERKGGEREMG